LIDRLSDEQKEKLIEYHGEALKKIPEAPI